MNAERLLEAFNRLGDEPETVQQFRKLVIGLAMSGKLIAPDEAVVDPASLSKQIEEKKVLLLRDGLLRKQIPLAALSHDDLPQGFNNPANFARLGSIARIEKGLTGIMKAAPGPYPLVVTAEDRASCDHFDFDGAAAIVPLVSSAGHGKASLQRLHYQEGKFALGSILAAIFPYAPELISARFLFEYLTSFKDELLVSQMIGTANVTLSVGKVSDVPVPLVSPSVQRKVDKLMTLCDRLEAARARREAVRDRLATASLASLNAPDRETFQTDVRFAIDALPALTTRPDQIKALRQTILNLASTGHLTAHWRGEKSRQQDAAQIVRMLEEAHERNGGHRRGNAAFATEGAHNFDPRDLPAGWYLTELRSAVRPDRPITYGILMPGPDTPGGVPYVRVADFPGDRLNLHTIKRTTKEIEEKYARARLAPNDILLSIRGTVGRTCVVPPQLDGANITQDTARLSLQDSLDRDFVLIVLRAPITQSRMQKCSKGVAVRGINIGDVRAIQLPIAPLAEQHRIVAKVDELMALCDRLEAGLAATAATRRRLLDALLAEALASAEDRELAAAE